MRNKTETTITNHEMNWAILAVVASGCPGYWSVILRAELAISNEGTANNIPPKTRLTMANTSEKVALVLGGVVKLGRLDIGGLYW